MVREVFEIVVLEKFDYLLLLSNLIAVPHCLINISILEKSQ